MLAKIKLYAMGFLALLATLFYGLWKHTAAAKVKQEERAKEKKREVEQLGNEAAYIGLKREQEIRSEDIDTDSRDYFDR